MNKFFVLFFFNCHASYMIMITDFMCDYHESVNILDNSSLPNICSASHGNNILGSSSIAVDNKSNSYVVSDDQAEISVNNAIKECDEMSVNAVICMKFDLWNKCMDEYSNKCLENNIDYIVLTIFKKNENLFNNDDSKRLSITLKYKIHATYIYDQLPVLFNLFSCISFDDNNMMFNYKDFFEKVTNEDFKKFMNSILQDKYYIDCMKFAETKNTRFKKFLSVIYFCVGRLGYFAPEMYIFDDFELLINKKRWISINNIQSTLVRCLDSKCFYSDMPIGEGFHYISRLVYSVFNVSKCTKFFGCIGDDSHFILFYAEKLNDGQVKYCLIDSMKTYSTLNVAKRKLEGKRHYDK